MTVAIRDLITYDEFVRAHDIQQQCWGFTQGEGLYPPMLNTAAHNGGVVLGAFDGDRMIGFLFGFLGLHEGQRLKLCSQTMGVLPEYRNQGVAARLKWAQRDRTLARGVDLITWTYDPLEAPNARLNLHTLGGCVHEYKRNIYGENFGVLGQGLPSDRFAVEWWLNSERVLQCARGKQTPAEVKHPIVNCCAGRDARRRIESIDLSLDAPVVRVEIPVDMQATKHADVDLALDWRMKTRQVFEAYFGRGYHAIDLLKMGEHGSQQNFYLLRAS